VVKEISRVIKDLLVPPQTKDDWLKEGNALYELKSNEKAICPTPNSAAAYYNKSAVLNGLERYDDALLACGQAIRLDPENAAAYTNKDVTLINLMRKK